MSEEAYPLEDEAPPVNKILSRFPGPITIISLTRRSVTRLTVALTLVMAVPGAMVVAESRYILPFVLLLGVGLAALLLVLFFWSGRLSVDAAGFEVVSPLNNCSTTWDNVDRFEVILTSVGRGARLPLVYCKTHHPPRDQNSCNLVVDRYFLSRSFDGEELSPEDLADLMTRWKDRALSMPTEPPAIGAA